MCTVLRLLQDNKLYLKQSKCFFGQESISHLGHVISAEGVAMDESKVRTVMDWPTPRTVRALRGFLGLAGYYCEFIKDYRLIAAPLTHILKKQAFSWSAEASQAFSALKLARFCNYLIFHSPS